MGDAADGIIYRGECGSGKGDDTTTSGFEGYWTATPDKFSNQFSKDLKEKTWEHYKGPGGNYQWKVTGEPTSEIIRLTTDIALLEDAEYLAIVNDYAENETTLVEDFDKAWDLLTIRGKGVWSTKAVCDDDGASEVPKTETQMRSDDATLFGAI